MNLKKFGKLFKISKFDPNTFSTDLKSANIRADLLLKRTRNDNEVLKRAIIQHVKKNEQIQAKMKLNSLISNENMMIIYENIKQITENIRRNLTTLNLQPESPSILVKDLNTLLYCVGKVDIPELAKIERHLTNKYDKDWVNSAKFDLQSNVDNNVSQALSPPQTFGNALNTRMQGLCNEANIEWIPFKANDMEVIYQAHRQLPVELDPNIDIRFKDEIVNPGIHYYTSLAPSFTPNITYDVYSQNDQNSLTFSGSPPANLLDFNNPYSTSMNFSNSPINNFFPSPPLANLSENNDSHLSPTFSSNPYPTHHEPNFFSPKS